jgi:hypothetical protein
MVHPKYSLKHVQEITSFDINLDSDIIILPNNNPKLNSVNGNVRLVFATPLANVHAVDIRFAGGIILDRKDVLIWIYGLNAYRKMTQLSDSVYLIRQLLCYKTKPVLF